MYVNRVSMDMTSGNNTYENFDQQQSNKDSRKPTNSARGQFVFNIVVSMATILAVALGICNQILIQEIKSQQYSGVSSLSQQQQNITSRMIVAECERLCYAGVKDGRVKDQDMSASSSWSSGYKASRGRLDNTGDPNGFWYPASGKENKPGEWLQVDFLKPVSIAGVITQGRPVTYPNWVTNYKISYGNSTSSMQTIQNTTGYDLIFQGNSDMNTHVTNMFPEPVTARYFRIIVQTVHKYTALRIEYLLCCSNFNHTTN